MALVEGAAVHSILLRLVKVEISWSRQSFIVEQAQFFSFDKSFILDLLFQFEQWSEFLSNWLRDILGHFYLLLAAWARHESK